MSKSAEQSILPKKLSETLNSPLSRREFIQLLIALFLYTKQFKTARAEEAVEIPLTENTVITETQEDFLAQADQVIAHLLNDHETIQQNLTDAQNKTLKDQGMENQVYFPIVENISEKNDLTGQIFQKMKDIGLSSLEDIFGLSSIPREKELQSIRAIDQFMTYFLEAKKLAEINFPTMNFFNVPELVTVIDYLYSLASDSSECYTTAYVNRDGKPLGIAVKLDGTMSCVGNESAHTLMADRGSEYQNTRILSEGWSNVYETWFLINLYQYLEKYPDKKTDYPLIDLTEIRNRIAERMTIASKFLMDSENRKILPGDLIAIEQQVEKLAANSYTYGIVEKIANLTAVEVYKLLQDIAIPTFGDQLFVATNELGVLTGEKESWPQVVTNLGNRFQAVGLMKKDTEKVEEILAPFGNEQTGQVTIVGTQPTYNSSKVAFFMEFLCLNTFNDSTKNDSLYLGDVYLTFYKDGKRYNSYSPITINPSVQYGINVAVDIPLSQTFWSTGEPDLIKNITDTDISYEISLTARSWSTLEIVGVKDFKYITFNKDNVVDAQRLNGLLQERREKPALSNFSH